MKTSPCREALVLVMFLLLVGALVAGSDVPPEQEHVIYRLATYGELMESVVASLDSDRSGEGLFVVAISASGFAVVVRPITVEEYGSYQVQAIAPEMIELQMLAAAIVLPAMAAEDVGAIDEATLALLKRAINEVSDVIIFGDVAFPQG